LKTSISKAAFASGLLVFIILLVLLFSRAGSTILLAICVVPGLVYGLALTASTNKPVSPIRAIFLVLLSMAINFTCVYCTTENFPFCGQTEAFKLVLFSAIGAILLTICYDLVLVRRFSVFRTLAMPLILGTAASPVSTLCMYLFISDKYDGFVSTILWVGMLTIFPLWQYLIGLNLDYHGRSTNPAKLSGDQELTT
jgi:hypothetical protein